MPLDPSTSQNARASRVDKRTGIREEIAFIGPHDQKMFGALHRPLGDPVGGVVVCCPLQAELVFNYRKEVLLARSLAATGVAVQRFHYRGTGNSDGDSTDLSYDSMVEDALAASQELRAATGVEQIAFLGTRWGGLIAGAASSETPLVLWEPALDGARYFKEVFRNRLIRNLKSGSATGTTHKEMLIELDSAGSIDILGYPIDKRLYDSAVGKNLAGAIGPEPRPILLTQISMSKELRGTYSTLVGSLTEIGFDVATEVIPDEESWWFQREPFQPEESVPAIGTLVDSTTKWLVDRLGQASGA